MLLKDLFSASLKGVTVNKSRSLLTMLGIIIGVGSVVLMSSIGASMQGVILSQISSLGSRSMVIFPGQDEGGPGLQVAGFDSLTFEDLNVLEQMKTIETVAPVIFVPGTTSYGREEGTPQVFGVTQNFFLNQNISVTMGRFLEEEDINGAKSVAVLAPDAQQKLFGNTNPLGKRIKVGNNHYTVVGVTKALGSQFFQNADNRVYVPFTVAKQVTGQRYLNYVTMQSVAPNTDLAIDDVTSTLRARHNIEDKGEDSDDDFIVRTAGQAASILGAVSLGLTMFITTIAAISLIVGGIGIMNIMLVSVTERTQEIGLRKAIGAKRRDILLQFLVESVLLTLIGGVMGTVGGILFAFMASLVVVNFLDTYHFVISVPSIIAAFVMAAGTGIVFGISPARKAAALSPMEALRYE